MRPASLRTIALIFGVAACSDPSGPNPGPTRSITVSLCAGSAPGSWFAYRNDGGDWTQASPNGSGQLVFDATDKVSVASVTRFAGLDLTVTHVVNATATELEATSTASCDAGIGAKSMSGSVVGLGANEFVRVSAGNSASDGATQADPNWLLEDLPDHPVDLVATRYATFSSQPAQQVLIRRGLLAANAAIPPLDFASDEAAAIETSAATFTGIPADGSLSMTTAVRTANGTFHSLGDLSTDPLTEGSETVDYASLPAALRLSTDMHALLASAFNIDGTLTLEHYYRIPSAKTLAFGPMLSQPAITNAATVPVVRPRAPIAAQAEYPSAMIALFDESAGQDRSRYVAVTTTAGFLGGQPATWELGVPDLSDAGYDPDWGLHTTTYAWLVTGYGTGNTGELFSTTLTDGLTVISATRAKDEVFGARLRVRGASPFSRLIRGAP